jgi:hypothetical protein
VLSTLLRYRYRGTSVFARRLAIAGVANVVEILPGLYQVGEHGADHLGPRRVVARAVRDDRARSSSRCRSSDD